MDAARATNRFLTEAEPWKLKGDENATRRQAIVRTSLEAIYAFMHFLAPVMPISAQKVFDALNTEPRSIHNLKGDFYNLTPGTPIEICSILFQKLVDPKEEAAVAAAAAAPATKTEEKKEKAPKGAKKESKESKPASTESAAPANEGPDPSKLEIRVGEIKRCWNHPESEKLLCEEIDIGEPNIRTIASGLRAHYSAEEMVGKKVLVLANLKERPMAGFKSQGMVLCAIGEGHSVVKLLAPPASAAVGDRVQFAGYSGEPLPAAQIAKKKVFESLAPQFRTNASGVPTWNNISFTINGDECEAVMPDAVVS